MATRKRGSTVNPLVAHLPALPDEAALTRLLLKKPAFSPAQRLEGSAARLDHLSNLEYTLCPRPEYLRFAELFDRILRKGYSKRRDLIDGNGKGLYEPLPGVYFREDQQIRVDGSCILVAGVTGSGKSSVVQSVGSMYPDLVDHGKNSGGKIQMVQIPVLYVRCPADSSLKAFARAFFRALDDRLQLHKFYERKVETTSVSTDLLTDAVSQACRTHAIGAIIFDEFQDIIEASRKSNRTIVNYLLYLRDTIKVPIVYVGTYPMLKLFEGDSRSARRAAIGGSIMITRYTDGTDPIWKLICETYWSLQWVRRPKKLSPDILKVLYSVSQGIPACLQIVFQRAQELAIETGCETVGVNEITNAYDLRCPELHRTIAALRSRNEAAIRSFEDLSHPWADRQAKRAAPGKK